MVFAGQDAWRRHPLIYNCARNPFPGLGLAVGIFSVYLVYDFVINLKAPELHKPVKYLKSNEFGDTMPQVEPGKKRKHSEHH